MSWREERSGTGNVVLRGDIASYVSGVWSGFTLWLNEREPGSGLRG